MVAIVIHLIKKSIGEPVRGNSAVIAMFYFPSGLLILRGESGFFSNIDRKRPGGWNGEAFIFGERR